VRIVTDNNGEHVVVLRSLHGDSGELPIAHDPAVASARGDPSGQPPTEDQPDEKSLRETEIVNELFDMIPRDGYTWAAVRMGIFGEDAKNPE
jgi:hypothetical protein